MAPGGRRRLGDLLLDLRLLTTEQLNAALHEQRKWGGRLGRTVVELGFITEPQMAEVLGGQLKLEVVDLDTLKVPAELPRLVRLDICERYGVFPVAIDHATRTLTVATADPTNIANLEAVQFAAGMKVQAAVSTATAIERAIRRHYFGEEPLLPEPSSSAPRTNTTFELNALLGGDDAMTRKTVEIPISIGPTPTPSQNSELQREVALLKERVESLEELNASHVKALRGLVEILIESGLVARDEYLEKLHDD